MYFIPLKKDVYDPLIDYLKGVCILFVVLTHCLPRQEYLLFSLWGAQAVPLFLLIQVFHTYKRGIENVKPNYNWNKLFHRIFKPFIFLLTIQILIRTFYPPLFTRTIDTLKTALCAGGIGPGSYYIWIYLQFFIFLPLLTFLFKRYNGWKLGVIFLYISQLFEWFCIYTEISDRIYRLLFLRYFFLIYLGYLWVINMGIKINKTTISLSVFSMVFILLFEYTNINFEPLFFQTAWKIFHWICYFYVAYLLVYILYRVYLLLSKKIKDLFCEMGKYSYEIFLMQMFVFTFFPSHRLSIIGNKYIEVMLFVLLTTSISIFPIILYKRYKNNRLCTNK